ncbi:MAG: glycosyltransferase family 2 protein [Deltaproteobacteria bacterium]|nr:glycosyltransferase family 2 protein [Deltaproteobacteria bacterium]
MISIIIPTYNEKDNIEPLLKKISEALSRIDSSWEIIIVDDNSPDGSSMEARRLSHSYPVSTVVRENKRGLATAVIRGFEEAKGEIIAVMDADLSHPPEYLVDLYNALERNKTDMVIGSRFVRGGGTENWSRRRSVMSWLARMISRGLCPVRDSTSGFFMFRKKLIQGVKLSPLGYKICLELLVKSSAMKVQEVPIIFRDRSQGASKLGWKVTINYFRHIARLYWWIIFRYKSGKDVSSTITFARFSIVGMSGIIVNYGIFCFLRMAFGMPHILAALLAIEISILTNFILNNFWTWRFRNLQGHLGLLKRILAYHLVAGIAAFGGNWGTLFVLADIFGMNIDQSYVLGIGIGMLINFFLNDRWTFARNFWEEERATR